MAIVLAVGDYVELFYYAKWWNYTYLASVTINELIHGYRI